MANPAALLATLRAAAPAACSSLQQSLIFRAKPWGQSAPRTLGRNLGCSLQTSNSVAAHAVRLSTAFAPSAVGRPELMSAKSGPWVSIALPLGAAVSRAGDMRSFRAGPANEEDSSEVRWRPTEGAPAQRWRRPRRARNGWEPDPEKLLTGDIQACESTEELAEVVRKHGPRFNFIHVAAVWKVLSRMHGPGAPAGRRLNEKLMKDVYGLTVDCAEDMDAMGVAAAMHGAANLHAYGRLKASPQRLAGALLQRAALVVDDFTPQGIANLMHGPVPPSRAHRAHRAHRSPRHCAPRPLLPRRRRRARRPKHAPVTGGGCPRWGCAPSPRCWARSRRARWPPPPTSSRRSPPLALSSPRLLPATLHHHPGHRAIEVLARSCVGSGGRERPHHLGDAISPSFILFIAAEPRSESTPAGAISKASTKRSTKHHRPAHRPPAVPLRPSPQKTAGHRGCAARVRRARTAPRAAAAREPRGAGARKPPTPPSLPYKVDTSRPPLRTNWTRLVPFPQALASADRFCQQVIVRSPPAHLPRHVSGPCRSTSASPPCPNWFFLDAAPLVAYPLSVSQRPAPPPPPPPSY